MEELFMGALSAAIFCVTFFVVSQTVISCDTYSDERFKAKRAQCFEATKDKRCFSELGEK